MKFFFKIILFILILSSYANSEVVKIFEFTKSEFKNLKERKVKGKTKWSFGSNEKGSYIRAEAKGTGSGLGKEIYSYLISQTKNKYFDNMISLITLNYLCLSL